MTNTTKLNKLEEQIHDRVYLFGEQDAVAQKLMQEYQKEMKKQEMLDKVISRLGFENEDTIYFATLCEELGTSDCEMIILEVHYEKLLNKNIWED